MNPEIAFRNEQQIPYGSTYFTGNLGAPATNNSGTVVLGSQATDSKGNVYTLLQGCVGLQPGDAVLYSLVDFSTVLALEGAQTNTLYQGVAVYVGGASNPANTTNLCGYFLTFGSAPVQVLAAVANGPVFLSTTPGSLSNAGVTQISGLVYSTNALGNLATVVMTSPNPTLATTSGAAPSGPVNATTLTSSGNATLGTGAGSTNTMGSGANSNNTIGGGANSTNNFGTGVGATNVIGEATGTNNVFGATNFHQKVTVGDLVLSALVVPDKPVGGFIPSIDNNDMVILQQGTPGQTLSIPAPVVTTDTKPLFIVNSGTTSVVINGTTLNVNNSMFALWDGFGWRSMATSGGGGVTTYAALTDAATVNLPTVNTPLMTALALITSRENQTGITGTTITVVKVMSANPFVYKNGQLLTPATDYSIAGQVITLVVAAIVSDAFSIIN